MLNKIYKTNKMYAEQAGKIDHLQARLFYERLGKIQNYSDRGDTYVQEGYQNNPIAFTITSIIAKHAGKARWKVMNKRTGMEIKQFHPITGLLANPTTTTCFDDYIQDVVTQKILTGNSFSAVSRFSKKGVPELIGKPKSLFMMPSNEIQLYLNDTGNTIEQYILDFNGAGYDSEDGVNAKDVMHIKAPNPDYSIEGDFLWGQSPFRAARRSIQTYNESLESGVWLLQNRGAESILINKDSDLELSPEAIDKLKNKLRLQAQSPQNAGNVPIIDANLDVLKVGSNGSDILLLEQRTQAAIEICNVVNFPVQLIGIESATYQNAKEAKKALWSDCIIPELTEVMNGLNRFLGPMYGGDVYLTFDLSDVDALMEDRLMRGEFIAKFAGLATYNQALEMAGLPIYEWMKPPTNMDEYKEQMYVSFTQGVIQDDVEATPINGENESVDKPKKKTT